MRRATSHAWISLRNERNDWFVLDHGALEKCKPTRGVSQYPRTVLFIGGETKARALRTIFPFNNHNRRKRDSFVNLVRDSLTSESERPILFSELNSIRPAELKADLLDDCKKHRLEWVDGTEQRMTSDEVYDTLAARFILPFYDVVCLFADDYRNHEHVALEIVKWAHMAHSTAIQSKPRLIIFSSSSFDVNQLPVCSSLFSHIRVSIQMERDELSYTAQYLRLRDTVLTELDIMQQAKASSRIVFEMRHLAALTDKALENFSDGTVFDPILAAKEFNPIDGEFSSHLEELVRVQETQIEVTEAMVIKLIASAIILDGFPVGAHSASSTL